MWLLPTLNRIKKLQTFLNSAIENETSTPGLILVDEKDLDAHVAEYSSLKMPSNWDIFMTGDAITMGDKIRKVWPHLTNENWVGLLNDDHFIATKNWDQKLLKKLDGKNFIHANDNWRCPTIATTATVWSKPLLDCVDWPIYPPGLNHLYIDDLWTNLGKATGCWRPVMSVIVEHHHALKGEMEQDETFHKVYDDYFAGNSRDTSVYELFMKHDFAPTVQKIKAFQDELPGQRYKPLNESSNKFVPTGLNLK